jgi:NAD/NADP transhydrogenase alpha subunit
LTNLIADGNLNIDLEDELIRETLVVRDGKIVHPRLLQS